MLATSKPGAVNISRWEYALTPSTVLPAWTKLALAGMACKIRTGTVICPADTGPQQENDPARVSVTYE